MACASISSRSPHHTSDIITLTLKKIKRSHEELKYVAEALHESANKKPLSERQTTMKKEEVQDAMDHNVDHAMAHYKESIDALEHLIKSDDGRFAARNYTGVRPRLVVVLSCEKENYKEYENYFYRRKGKHHPYLKEWEIPVITK